MPTPKPTLSVELEPGNYLVSVHPSYGVRTWKQDQQGALFIGKTGRIKRTAIAEAFRDLTIEAEKVEGIER
jgi:hypothetical protein